MLDQPIKKVIPMTLIFVRFFQVDEIFGCRELSRVVSCKKGISFFVLFNFTFHLVNAHKIFFFLFFL